MIKWFDLPDGGGLLEFPEVNGVALELQLFNEDNRFRPVWFVMDTGDELAEVRAGDA